MDIKAVLDAMSSMGRVSRADYHLTLGDLTAKLRDLPRDMSVEFDDGAGVGEENSYRGYYDDLAFGASPDPSTVFTVLEACERAAVKVYTGYKGGDFRYDERAPLWRAKYGCCGPAIVDATVRDGKLVLITRDVD